MKDTWLVPENKLHFPALDGFRTFALLLVMAEHYVQLPFGWAGVDLFFVLSGFLITGILYDSRDAPSRLRTFYIRRTLRIFPLFYGVLFGLLALTPLLHWRLNAYWLLWPTYLGNITRFLPAYRNTQAGFQAANGFLTREGSRSVLYLGHFWSLCVEEQFYLAWPFVVFFVKDRGRLIRICVATAVLCPLLRIAAAAFLPPHYMQADITYRLTPFRIDALLLGGLLSLLWRGRERDAMIVAGKWIAAVGLPAVVIFLLLTVHHHSLYQYPSGTMTWGLTVIDLLSAGLLICTLLPGNPAYRLFVWSPLQWLGRISYGAYVFHDIPHNFYVRQVEHAGQRSHFIALHQSWFTFSLAFVGTVLMATASFYCFERPILKLKDKLAPPIRSASVSASAQV